MSRFASRFARVLRSRFEQVYPRDGPRLGSLSGLGLGVGETG